ncbi:excalibur calcium-binding domain-containing protein [Sphaerisporangium sp. B11E5]|uniref:excalibur calcium-binding domain-containing protein n=1 Tax=Sphaerisporangium sp. B11E5 TaxID=3153563 RepID=UPI00325C4054
MRNDPAVHGHSGPPRDQAGPPAAPPASLGTHTDDPEVLTGRPMEPGEVPPAVRPEDPEGWSSGWHGTPTSDGTAADPAFDRRAEAAGQDQGSPWATDRHTDPDMFRRPADRHGGTDPDMFRRPTEGAPWPADRHGGTDPDMFRRPAEGTPWPADRLSGTDADVYGRRADGSPWAGDRPGATDADVYGRRADGPPRPADADAFGRPAAGAPWAGAGGVGLDDGPVTDPAGFGWSPEGQPGAAGWRHGEQSFGAERPGGLSEPEELSGPGGPAPGEPRQPEGPFGPEGPGGPGGPPPGPGEPGGAGGAPPGPPRAARATTIALVTALVVVVLVTGVLGTIAVLMTRQPDVPLGAAPPRRLATTIHFAPVTGVRAAPCPGAEAVLDDAGTTCYQVAPGVTVTSVLKVEAIPEQDQAFAVRVVLAPESRDRLADLTRDSIDQQLAVVVADRVVAAPRVAQPLTVDSLSISGFTKDQADTLVARLLGTGAAPSVSSGPGTCPPTAPGQGQPGAPTGQPGAPTASGQPGAPTASGQPGAPTASGQPGAPTSQGQPGAPTSQGQPGAPTSQGQPGAPTSQGQPGAPTSQGQPGNLTSQGQPGAPTASGQPGAPTSQGQPGAPTSQDLPGAPLSPGGTNTCPPSTAPSTGPTAPGGVPSTGGSVGAPSTAPTGAGAGGAVPLAPPTGSSTPPSSAGRTDPAARTPSASASRPTGTATRKPDTRFASCKQANAAGYGPYTKGVHPEYHWYIDGDQDGVACERGDLT